MTDQGKEGADKPVWENRFAVHNLIRDLSRI